MGSERFISGDTVGGSDNNHNMPDVIWWWRRWYDYVSYQREQLQWVNLLSHHLQLL